MRKKRLKQRVRLLEAAYEGTYKAFEGLRDDANRLGAEVNELKQTKSLLHKECVEYATQLTQLEKKLDALKEENTSLKFSNCTLADDVRAFSQRVGRVQYDIHFETPAGAKQQATAYVIPAVGAYAPILGHDAPTFRTLEALIEKLAPAFAVGTRHTKTVRVTRE